MQQRTRMCECVRTQELVENPINFVDPAQKSAHIMCRKVVKRQCMCVCVCGSMSKLVCVTCEIHALSTTHGKVPTVRAAIVLEYGRCMHESGRATERMSNILIYARGQHRYATYTHAGMQFATVGAHKIFHFSSEFQHNTTYY